MQSFHAPSMESSMFFGWDTEVPRTRNYEAAGREQKMLRPDDGAIGEPKSRTDFATPAL